MGGAFTSYKGLTVNNLVRLHADGTIDQTFVTGTGFDNTVFTLLLADDGSGDLYVGGAFNNYNGNVANNLVRLNSNGVRDLSFATGAGFNNTVFHVVPVGDGSGDLYVGGAFTSYNGLQGNEVVRLNQNGTMDLAFSTGAGFSNTVLPHRTRGRRERRCVSRRSVHTVSDHPHRQIRASHIHRIFHPLTKSSRDFQSATSRDRLSSSRHLVHPLSWAEFQEIFHLLPRVL